MLTQHSQKINEIVSKQSEIKLEYRDTFQYNGLKLSLKHKVSFLKDAYHWLLFQVSVLDKDQLGFEK